MNQAVTELIVRGRTEGVTQARTEVEALERAHEQAQAATERATLGMERMSARVQSRLDPQFRATQQLAKVEADLDLLRQRGLITLERQNALMAMATQRYAAVGTAARGAAVGMAAPGQAAQLSAFQVQNLSFQMNDIAMGLATGQSPFRVMAQQGSQIVQIFGSGTGVVAAVKAAGASLTSFLINPLTLTAIGFGLALEAGMRFFSSVTGGSDELEDRLERQADLVKRISEHYKEAAGAARELPATLSFLADREIERLQTTLRGQVQDLFAQGAVSAAVGQSPGLGGEFGIANPALDPNIANRFRELASAVQVFQREMSEGRDPAMLLLEFNEQISRLARASEDPAFKAMGEDILRLTGGFDNADDSATGLALGIRELIDAARQGAAALASLKRELEAFGKALEQLEGIGRDRLSPRDLAAEQLRKAVDAAQGIDDITVALNAYEAALNRVRAAEEKIGLAELADAQFRLANIALSEHARGVAEINREYDKLIAKAREAGADTTLLERRRGIDLQAFDAGRQAEFNGLIADRRQALAEEAGALGLSETALAKYRTEIELTNAAMRLFGTVSPEMAAQIRELGDAAAAAVETQRRMAEQIAAMDASRDTLRGFLGDLAGGLRQGESAADALLAALNRLLDRLLNMGLDMIVAGLLGQGGTAGGGLFGGLLSGVLSGGLFSGAGSSAGQSAGGGASLGSAALGSASFGGSGSTSAAPVPVTVTALPPLQETVTHFSRSLPASTSALHLGSPTLDFAGGGSTMAQNRLSPPPVMSATSASAEIGDLVRGHQQFTQFGPRVTAFDQTIKSDLLNMQQGATDMADATTQAADTLSAGLPQAADQMTSAARQAATGAEQLGAGVTGAGQTAQDAAGQFSGAFPGALQQVIQSIASAGGGAPFGGFSGGNFFGAFLGGGGFGGAPGFTPGVVMSRHRGGIVGDIGADNDNAMRLASPAWFRNAVRAHGGLSLAPDERPIIAQTGERVLSRAETTEYEQRGRRGGGGAPAFQYRAGNVTLHVASDVPEKTVARLQAMLEENNARERQELKATFGEYQNSYATLKAG